MGIRAAESIQSIAVTVDRLRVNNPPPPRLALMAQVAILTEQAVQLFDHGTLGHWSLGLLTVTRQSDSQPAVSR
jgi:hypothetical protein